jgi:hypothetical protein
VGIAVEKKLHGMGRNMKMRRMKKNNFLLSLWSELELPPKGEI